MPHFGVMDENGMKSNEKKTIHIASQLKKKRPNVFITPGNVLFSPR